MTRINIDVFRLALERIIIKRDLTIAWFITFIRPTRIILHILSCFDYWHLSEINLIIAYSYISSVLI